MSNFVLVYTGSGEPEGQEAQEAMMAAWMAWYEKMGDTIVDPGEAFSGSKKITADGISDGAVSSPPASGYTIISADTLDEAADMVKDHPHIKHGGQISVYETMEM